MDLVSWSYTLIINSSERYSYVKRRLNALNYTANKSPLNQLSTQEDKKLFRKFVNDYLREDGVLALRLLSRNSQDLIVSEVVSNLYSLYKSQQRQQQQLLRQQQLLKKRNIALSDELSTDVSNLNDKDAVNDVSRFIKTLDGAIGNNNKIATINENMPGN